MAEVEVVMGARISLWLVLACSCAEPLQVTETPTAASAEAVPAMPPPMGVRAGPPRSAAPLRDVWGLSLGRSGHDELSTWLTNRGLHCGATPSPRRKTVHYRCGDVPGALLLNRVVGKTVSTLILARPDDGPLHHVSTLRRYAEPQPAIADYTSTRDTLRARLGPPADQDATPPSVAAFDAKATRFLMRWLFSDLEVELSLYRLAGPDIVVRERWDVPGVESGVEARGRGSVHGPGGGPHSPHGIVVPTGRDSLPGSSAH